jgi:pSer/pThr/pTyr-binding forkhead associated (FHA) protein
LGAIAVVDKATLLVVRGVDQGSRFEVGEALQSLGRGARNEIRILDTEVSRLHAEILNEDGAYVLLDKRSSNGTFVNGKQIRRHVLENGDQIQIGRSVLLFARRGADESQLVAERIELQLQHPDDQSSIIGEISHDGDSLLKDSQDAGGANLGRSLANLKTLYRISHMAMECGPSKEEDPPQSISRDPCILF